MSIIRSLDSFSLPELFKLIASDSKSGRLMIETPISQETTKRKGIYYIWFEDGYLIAFSDCLNQKGLIDLIDQRSWISPAVICRLRKLCPAGVPLGNYLEKMKLLDREKLNLVFQLQLHQVYSLFKINGGRFRFDNFAELQDRILTIPWLEMTGHRLKSNEASMYALRLMENSENFAGQLPTPNQVLRRAIAMPNLRLTTIERQLWDFADNKTSLLKIARNLQQPLPLIQATAFRLSAVGLVDTVFPTQSEWLISPETSDIFLQSEKSQFSSNLERINPDSYLDREEVSLLNTIGNIFKRKNA